MSGYLSFGYCHSSVADALTYFIGVYSARQTKSTDLVPGLAPGVDYSLINAPAPLDVSVTWQQRQAGSTAYVSILTLQACDIEALRMGNVPADDYQSLFTVVLTTVLFGSAIRAVFRAIS